ncbi:hypothetical protein NFI96_000586 [Prochilodus magdalenae]|nr:hypothetical protein NFI96_000586 [Prochilodus magdalenae]
MKKLYLAKKVLTVLADNLACYKLFAKNPISTGARFYFQNPISTGAMGFDVIGYSGGSLIMYFNYQQSGQNPKYFCMEFTNPKSQKECIFINPGQAQTTFSYKDKVFLFDNSGAFTVIYRHLGVQDAGTYQCGEQGVWNYNVRVKINTDPCCMSPKIVNAYLGETVTISCSYPEAIKDNYKYFFKFSNVYTITQVATTIEAQQGRFSISEDKGSRLLTVRIREVREDDGGLYSCGVGVGGTSFNYYTLFPEIRLQVTAFRATNRTTLISPSKDGSSSVVIPVCVCVVLLLIGGSALIFYRVRCRRTQEKEEPTKPERRGDRTLRTTEETLAGVCGIISEAGVQFRMKVLLIFTLYLISEPKTETGYLGETVTINCSYPDQYERHKNNFYKFDGQYVTALISTTETQRDRFSISKDRGSKAVSVRISDVREGDGGGYYCGVSVGGESVSYYSLYTEIQLQVTAPGSSIIIIITVCVCVVLLLIGGSALIFYRLRCRRTQVTGSTPSSRTEPKDPGSTYTTVLFLKNPDSPTNAAVTVKFSQFQSGGGEEVFPSLMACG